LLTQKSEEKKLESSPSILLSIGM